METEESIAFMMVISRNNQHATTSRTMSYGRYPAHQMVYIVVRPLALYDNHKLEHMLTHAMVSSMQHKEYGQ